MYSRHIFPNKRKRLGDSRVMTVFLTVSLKTKLKTRASIKGYSSLFEFPSPIVFSTFSRILPKPHWRCFVSHFHARSGTESDCEHVSLNRMLASSLYPSCM